MNIFSSIKSYIDDDELKIINQKDRVNIQNYDNILNFDSSKIVIIKDLEKISIYGNDLVTSKLMDEESLRSIQKASEYTTPVLQSRRNAFYSKIKDLTNS